MLDIIHPMKKHFPCVFLVDCSDSVSSDKLEEVNQSLREFAESLKSDSRDWGCADICVISFNSQVTEVVPFCPDASFQPPCLKAEGMTSMNEAIITGLDAIEMRKREYKDLGVAYWRPLLILLSSGSPTDAAEYKSAAMARLHCDLDRKRVSFMPICIGPDANIPLLKEYTKDGAGRVLDDSTPLAEAFIQLCPIVYEPYYQPSPDTSSENNSIVIEL